MSHPPQAGSNLKMGLPIPNSKLGMWLFLGTEIMFFTAFIGSYIVLRMGSQGWPTSPEVTHISIKAGGINTFVLIVSSYFVEGCMPFGIPSCLVEDLFIKTIFFITIVVRKDRKGIEHTALLQTPILRSF